MTEPMTQVSCSRCGTGVSSPVQPIGGPLIVRAFVECPECVEGDGDTVPVDRELLREINTYRKSVMFATGPLLALLDRLPDQDQP